MDKGQIFHWLKDSICWVSVCHRLASRHLAKSPFDRSSLGKEVYIKTIKCKMFNIALQSIILLILNSANIRDFFFIKGNAKAYVAGVAVPELNKISSTSLAAFEVFFNYILLLWACSDATYLFGFAYMYMLKGIQDKNRVAYFWLTIFSLLFASYFFLPFLKISNFVLKSKRIFFYSSPCIWKSLCFLAKLAFLHFNLVRIDFLYLKMCL